MVIFTFFGSFLPDSVRIGTLHLRVKPFLDRPLQCYGCYKYGHGRKHCTERPRCGNCSALDSHPTENCESNSYCFHCREAHPVRSRQCSQYRLEQDILQMANTQFISLGSARRELAFRQGNGGEVRTFASSLRPPSSPSFNRVSTARTSVPVVNSSRSSVAASTGVSTSNAFRVLGDESVGRSAPSDPTPAAKSGVSNTSQRPHYSHKVVQKRQYRSTDSLDVRPSKIPTCSVDGPKPTGCSAPVVAGSPLDTSMSPSVQEVGDSSSCREAVSLGMEVSQDAPLVDESVPDLLERQMSQDSLTSVISPKPTSCPSSDLDPSVRVEDPGPSPGSSLLSEAVSPRPGSSRDSVESRVGPPAAASTHRTIKLVSKGGSGRPPSGTRPKFSKK